MIVALFILVLALAYANGANDVSKGVSTLVGSGLASYRRALAWGTCWTVLGASVAVAASMGLASTFSTGLLVGAIEPERFPLAVTAGAFGWVIVASRTGLPVSTTHALTGAIVGAALAAGGAHAVQWSLLLGAVALPLAVSPIVSGALAYALHLATAVPLARAARYCVCLENRPLALEPVPGAGASRLVAAPVTTVGIAVGSDARCEDAWIASRVRLTDAAHWASSAALSFARGLNDSPKIVALALSATAAAGIGAVWLFLAGAAAMGLGSYLYGRRVTTTLAERVTDIDPLEGLSASAVASALVLLASLAALPVSTTHVATGAIVGAGLRDGARAIEWRTVAEVVAAWLITLPVAALVAAGVWWIL